MIDADTDNGPPDPRGSLAAQRSYWMQLREAAAVAFGNRRPRDEDEDRIRDEHRRGEPYLFADRSGRRHECRTVTQLAEVTRADRRWCNAVWPEDRH